MSDQPQTLIIESILIRSGGTLASTRDGTEYHFAPNKLGHHVAFFDDMGHAQEFLKITEGYRIYDGGENRRKGAKAEPVEPVEPVGVDSGDSDGLHVDVVQTHVAAPLEGASIEELRVIFENEVGRKPSEKAKAETLIAQIEAVREETKGQA